MRTSDFDYSLPAHLIAQKPIYPRDHSRLLVVRRSDAGMEHHLFSQIVDLVHPGEVMVFNETRVIPARLSATREGGGRVEILLLQCLEDGSWEVLLGRGRKVRIGDRLTISHDLVCEVKELKEGGVRVIQFSSEELLSQYGETPLPPYIHETLPDPERYQTCYAKVEGSVAAPTAGLHFTPELISSLQHKGVVITFITLHVGLGSFRPVREEDPQDHHMHKEYCDIPEEACQKINEAKEVGKRIICVGTTTVRALESATSEGKMQPFSGWTELLILPGYSFNIVDALLTNFHLPRSTLLMLVSAFAGKETTRKAYTEAIKLDYRFLSFGDAMFII
jgi:S-adenosylmethionine:tRNA ribosyltransferase-isomerase